MPVLAVYVPLLVKFPPNPTTAAPFSVNVPPIVTSEPNTSDPAAVSVKAAPLLIVTAPVKVFVPVLASVNVPETDVVPPTVRVHVFVAPVINVDPELMVSGTPAFKVNAAYVVIAPVFVIMIPPVAVKGVIHSSAVAVYAAGLLYCSVAFGPYVITPAVTMTVAVPSKESTPLTVGVVANVFIPEPESVRLK